MPAITTELDWTTDHLLKFMLQTGRFRNANGTLAEDRIEAAQTYLQRDWEQIFSLRLAVKDFDPERPGVDELHPNWREDPDIAGPLAPYLAMKAEKDELEKVIQSGPNKEYTRATNALLMTQRVDLWCAGEKEVELAVQHLYKLGRLLNEQETFFPAFIKEFYPGVEDI